MNPQISGKDVDPFLLWRPPLHLPDSMEPPLTPAEDLAPQTRSNTWAPPAALWASHTCGHCRSFLPVTWSVGYASHFPFVPVLVLSVEVVHLHFLLKSMNFPKAIMR